MKNSILRFIFLLALVISLVLSFASCDAVFEKFGIGTSQADTDDTASDDALNNAPNGDESNDNNANTDESNKNDANVDDSNKDDTNVDDSNKDDTNVDDSNKDDTNVDDSNKDDTNTDESGTDDSGTNGTEEHKHSFSPWITTKPATCQEVGEMARACMTCGERESQTTEKSAHTYENNVCKVCGEPNSFAGATDIGKMDSFDYSKIPEYSGFEYVILNGNVPFFTEEEKVTESYETYGAWDSLGRCTVVVACVGQDLMPTEDRKNTSFEPSGWVQADYTFVPGGKLYNRCHLIAWQLTAETNNRQNLITGTRYMNEAMIPFENMVASYIKETNNHVMYRVTPIFLDNNLVASGILLEAYSVEDDGDAISFNLFFYNVQPGVTIDYATGKSAAGDDAPETDTVPEDCDYVLNTSSKKIHTPDCHNVSTMSDKNKDYYSGDIQDLLDDGYTAAGCCKPT